MDIKKIVAIAALGLAVAGCGGGYDTIDAAREGLGGMSSTGSDSNRPTNPDQKSLWEYGQSGTSRLANIKSLNTVPTPNNEYNDALMTVQIHNFVNSQGEAKDYLNITVLFADTRCAGSCQLRFKRNGSTSAVYQVRESINGVFSENSFAPGDMEKLIKLIKMSGKASITVPLIGVPDAEFEFDFSGYDESRMSP